MPVLASERCQFQIPQQHTEPRPVPPVAYPDPAQADFSPDEATGLLGLHPYSVATHIASGSLACSNGRIARAEIERFHQWMHAGATHTVHDTRQCSKRAVDGGFCGLHTRAVRITKLTARIEKRIAALRGYFLQMSAGETRQDMLRECLKDKPPEIAARFADLLEHEEWALPRPEYGVPQDFHEMSQAVQRVEHGLGGVLAMLELPFVFDELKADFEERAALIAAEAERGR